MSIRPKLICLFCLLCVRGYCQEIIIDANKMVTDEAFARLLFNDLNFLVVGDNTPSQGFSTELTEKNTELSLKGLLLSNKNSFFTVDGKFSVDDGVYFFDENGGSKSSKFTLNYFRPLNKSINLPRSDKKIELFESNRNYPTASIDSIARTLLIGDLERRSSFYTTLSDFYISKKLMEDNGLPAKDFELLDQLDLESFQEINKDLKDYYSKRFDANDKSIEAIAVDKAVKKYIADNKLEDISVGLDENQNYKIVKIEGGNDRIFPAKSNARTNDVIYKDLDQLKLMKNYEKAIVALDSIKYKTIKSDLTRAEKKWKSVYIPYYSLSIFYQRENLTIFEEVIDVDFDDLFNEQLGDLFGIEGSLNFYRSSRNYTFYLRFLGSYGRGSNLKDFSKKTYQNISLLNPDDETILIADEKIAYNNEQPYSYGASSTLSAEFYFFMGNFGLFGTVGHNGTYYDFEKKSINDSHRYPFRAGIIGNLKPKKDAKTALTLQVFIDRSDLSIDPRGTLENPIDDWRFGFKFGLPIFLKPNK